MRVRCIKNEVAAVGDSDVRERIRRSIHLEGPITDLAVGHEYAVQAMEQQDGGIWYYLHTVPTNDYPFPYPAELFEVCNNDLPSEWSICIQKKDGNVVWKRMALPTWACDDLFYERLVDGDTETVTIYRRGMLPA